MCCITGVSHPDDLCESASHELHLSVSHAPQSFMCPFFMHR